MPFYRQILKHDRHVAAQSMADETFHRQPDTLKAISVCQSVMSLADTFLLVQIRNAGAFERFVRLCAGRVGQLLNLNSLGNDAGVSHTTAREWISILEASYIIFQMPPYILGSIFISGLTRDNL